jgi:hypothetical protein
MCHHFTRKNVDRIVIIHQYLMDSMAERIVEMTRASLYRKVTPFPSSKVKTMSSCY